MPQANCIVGNLSTKAINCWTHGQFKKHDDKLNTAGPEIIDSTSYFAVAAYITHNATNQFASTIGGIIIRLQVASSGATKGFIPFVSLMQVFSPRPVNTPQS